MVVITQQEWTSTRKRFEIIRNMHKALYGPECPSISHERRQEGAVDGVKLWRAKAREQGTILRLSGIPENTTREDILTAMKVRVIGRNHSANHVMAKQELAIVAFVDFLPFNDPSTAHVRFVTRDGAIKGIHY
jgi:hypothetical protein